MKHLKLFITFIALFISSAMTWAQSFTVGGINYTVISEDDATVRVTGNDGTPTILNGTVVYNDKTYNVAEIKSYAFCDCSSLTSVGDLSACTAIGDDAFRGCESLVSVGELSACTTIGVYAFYRCSSLTSVGDLSACTSIGNNVFSSCSSLTSVGDLSACTAIGDHAFSNCTSLTSIGDLSACILIDKYAFSGCSSLTSVVDLSACASIGTEAFTGCTSLTSIGNLSACTSIGDRAFSNCRSLTSVGNLSACTSIGIYAFYNCSALISVGDLSACTAIGDGAFRGCESLVSVGELSACTYIGSWPFEGCINMTLVTLGQTECSFGGYYSPNITVFVPAAALETYHTADKWKDIARYILATGSTTNYDITVTAQESSSDVIAKIGEANLGNVCSLKVTGTINGYDIMAIRNKMINLHHLDLSDASIVANPYEYYTGCHTENNILGPNSFSGIYLSSVKLPRTLTSVENAFKGCSKLLSVEMYEGITAIGDNSFSDCGLLSTINLPSGIKTIGWQAFYNCKKITSLILPEGLEIIGARAFQKCGGLTSVTFPSTLLAIDGGYNGSPYGAFCECTRLASINLPTSLTTIGGYAFYGCSSLKEVRIPSSIISIGDYAFTSSALKDIYTWTIEPVSIGQNTFYNWETATIHTPATSHDNYFYDTQWSQFLTQVDFDEPYEYFYINNDYTLDDQTNGRIDGTPDADLNEGSGLIVEGNTDQDLGDVVVHDNGEGTGASIIGDGNINAHSLVFEITIKGGKWHFFCFPFNVLLSDIVAPTNNWVFRRYDGQERASNGNGGWKNLPVEETMLHAGQGYIFQCNKNGTLRLTVRSSELTGKFAAIDKHCTMTTYTAANAENASWNFIGNPHLSYYDMDDLLKNGLSELFSAPITRWNSSTNSYEAIRPGDDDYFFHPFEAFFVQKPEGVSTIDFDSEFRLTCQQSQAMAPSKAYSRKVNPDRMLINVEISDGTNSDKTRVVFNNKQSMDYEIGCDASKFLSSDVPQLYTLDRKQVKYAINERPIEDGSVALGFSVTKAGQYEIAATRMDCPMLLLDQKLGTTFDLSLGSYSFTAEAGSNSDRFFLVKDSSVTGVSDLMAQTGVSVMPMDGGLNIKGAEDKPVSIYTTAGVRVADGLGDGYTALQGGTYIVKVGNKSAKVMVK